MVEKRSLRERLQRFWQYIKDRTGFFAYIDAEGNAQRGKTLWDWLDLLIVPTVLAVAALGFSYAIRQSDLAIADANRQSDLAIAETNRLADLDIAENRLQEEKLNAYLAKMEGYILDWELLSAEDQENVVIIRMAQDRELLSAEDQENLAIIRMAQEQTVTALRSMDKQRRNLVFQFLRDFGLIDFILIDASLGGIDLTEANMYDANLAAAYLFRADLTNALLIGVDLRGADLSGADLHWANLSGGNLSEANLSKTCLSGAIVTEEQLDSASSIEGAIMPDEDYEKCFNR